ncbi:hypothetical protein SAMN04488052_103301 [Aquisalimonas asiatica]|uniref:Methyltransferase domain-containing protein n=1 Tax=Aquisalimonas asiatica TaxID=406100 RepID=A0A1H8SYY1_9GAMM|nr:hypothetical protein SAMN04488052_103301 [Aquisalimonas asiatica]
MRSLNERFKLILVSAVWMHVPPSERERAFRILSELLAPGGVLVITLRHGPSPDERCLFDTSLEELESFARARALVTIAASGSRGAQAREGVSWETLVFRLPEGPIN